MPADSNERMEFFKSISRAIAAERTQKGMAFDAVDDALLATAAAGDTPLIGCWNWWPDVDPG